AVLNLVDNAVKATSRGEPIELSASIDGSHIRILIGDSGNGIPAAQRAAVLGRFSRPGARDADGSGLGLAIVKAVAEAHGGTVEVGSSNLGGAQVAIVIPIGVQERDADPDR
ncbi:MAG TPA: sensor histidine kinase, partial [Acidimicrobiales bacterium]|nr:sensor histidine kinase [Acidimicrobiales bacterium]